MGINVIVSARPPLLLHLSAPSSIRRRHCSLSSSSVCCPRRHRQSLLLRRLRPLGIPICRFDNFTSKCSITNIDVDLDHVTTVDEFPEEHSSLQPDCTLPFLHLTSDVLDPEPANLLKEESYIKSVFTELPVLSDEEQDALAATPAHTAGLYAFYASYLAGNLVEQLWNFAWPAAVAVLHPSLLPVAVLGFFAKLAIFVGAPVVGHLMDHFPRIPAYNCLNIVQTAAQLLSVAMVICALNSVCHTSASVMLLQPWFIILVIAGALERIAGVALGVTMERDWVVLLAGANRPIALAQANAMLSRIDLVCEIAGASVFGILLSKYDTVICLKLASGLMICTLPVLIILGQLINRFSSGVLDRCKVPQSSEQSFGVDPLPSVENIVQHGMDAIRCGWMEYKHQPVLPASVAYVLLYFNIALTPGAIMTAFLMHHGTSPSVIGGFSGLCAFMGVAATFISATLVKKLGIWKAGAAGLVFQALLLTMAVAVVCSSSISQQTPLLLFLSLIVLSRLGHMSYDVVGTQILQTGIPLSKANLIGATEVSIASLAEFLMLGVAIIANDVSHFGFLAMLSMFSVVGAAWMFCRWLANPTTEQRELFSFDPQFS